MKFSTFIKIAAGALVVALLIFVLSRRGSSTATEGAMDLGVVKRQDLIERVTISGQIWPKHRLDIKPPFNGYIAKLYVKIGDTLKRGNPIVTFSPSLSANEVNFPVRAGFEGVVTQVLKGEGEYVTEQGDQNLLVARFEDLSDIYVLASVPELDIAKIKIGQDALVRVSSLVGETFEGKVTEISLSARDKDRYGSQATEFQIRWRLRVMTSGSCPGCPPLWISFRTNAKKSSSCHTSTCRRMTTAIL